MPKEPLCERTSAQARAFLADLLSDAEYDSVAAHAAECDACREYLRSLGDLTNQVWALGAAEVPPDFSRTVLFKLKREPDARPAPPVYVLALLLAAVAALFFFLGRTRVPEAPPEPVMRVSLAADPAPAPPPSAHEEVSLETVEPHEPAEAAKTLLASLPAPTPGPAAAKPAENAARPREVHWHVVFSDEWEAAAAERRDKLTLLQSRALELGALEDEARALERLSGAANKEKILDLNKQAEELQDEIRELEDQSRDTPKAADPKSWFSAALFDSGVRFQTPSRDLFVFSAPAERVARLSENMLAGRVYAPLEYSAGSAAADGETGVSVYAETAPDAGLHWHLAADAAGRKAFEEALREYGASKRFESRDSLVFSISRDQARRLEARIRALGIGMNGFGRAVQKGDVLGDVPVVVSVYFTN